MPKSLMSGEPFVVTSPEGIYHEECCDCGLVHLVKIAPQADGSFVIYCWRDDYDTMLARKERRKRKRSKK